MKYPDANEQGYSDEDRTLMDLAEQGQSIIEYAKVAVLDWRAKIDWWKAAKEEIKQSNTFVEQRTKVAESNIAYFYGRLERLSELKW